MSSGKKRHLSPSPHRTSDSKRFSLHDLKGRKCSRDESESSHSSSCSASSPEKKSSRKKKDRKKRKHRHRSSSSDSSSPKRKKKRKEKKKHKSKKKKKKHKTCEKHRVEEKFPADKSIDKTANEARKGNEGLAAGPTPRVMKPMTKEEWEKQQSVVRRVYDPETGRNRLVKGDGEIIEEIVSKVRHRDINKQATRGDGAFFQAKLGIQDK